MVEPNFEDLLESARAGGRREAEALLKALRPLTCRWALVWTGSPDAAEDIAQKVLMRVHKSIQTYCSTGKLTTWVYRITRNVLIDWERDRGSTQRLQDRLKLSGLAQEVAEQDQEELQARELLRRLMENLSPRQRTILDLVDLQGFEPKDVADMLELAPETVRVHLHRAREALRARGEEIKQSVTEAQG